MSGGWEYHKAGSPEINGSIARFRYSQDRRVAYPDVETAHYDDVPIYGHSGFFVLLYSYWRLVRVRTPQKTEGRYASESWGEDICLR